MSDISFHHVALTCESVARIEKFYCDNLGFSRKRAFQIGEGKEIVYISNGVVYMELFPKEAERPRFMGRRRSAPRSCHFRR